jgi:hypothetical protein
MVFSRKVRHKGKSVNKNETVKNQAQWFRPIITVMQEVLEDHGLTPGKNHEILFLFEKK